MIYYNQILGIHQRQVGDDLCLLKQKDKFIHKLNPSAALLWQALEEPSTLDDLAKVLVKHYQIDLDQARSDTQQFLDYYLKEKLITKSSQSSKPQD